MPAAFYLLILPYKNCFHHNRNCAKKRRCSYSDLLLIFTVFLIFFSLNYCISNLSSANFYCALDLCELLLSLYAFTFVTLQKYRRAKPGGTVLFDFTEQVGAYALSI